MESLQEFLKTNYTIFFSHQWLGWQTPDPVETQFPIMQEAAKKLAAINGSNLGSSLDKTFVWFDYGR